MPLNGPPGNEGNERNGIFGTIGRGILGALGTVLPAISSIGRVIGNTADFFWNRKAQKMTWQREDTSRQRAVQDMRMAGLSPTLAAGSPAQTSTPMQMRSPANDLNGIFKSLETQAKVKNINLQSEGIEMKNYLTFETLQNEVQRIKMQTQEQLFKNNNLMWEMYLKEQNFDIGEIKQLGFELDNAIKQYNLDNLLPQELSKLEKENLMKRLTIIYMQFDAISKAQAGLTTDTNMSGYTALLYAVANNVQKLLLSSPDFSSIIDPGN